MDGTFAIVPELFLKLYTIHALIGGEVICCIYSLLPNKTSETYQHLFLELKGLIPSAQPSTVMMDYEQAAMNSVAVSFTGVQIQCCFYHLSQSLYRKVQALGFQQRYQEEEDFSISVRMIPALAFVPIHDVVRVFEALQEATSDADILQLLDFFEDTYLGRSRRRGRASPLFSHEIWSVHNRVVNDLPRTNNNVEGWNRKMQSAVAAHHPNLWRFLTVLRREHSLVNTVIAQRLGGHPSQPARKKYHDCTERIINIVNEFPNRDPCEYLRSIAHNIQF